MEQRWKSRVYRSIFFSYLVVLLVPILVSPLVLYGAGDAISQQMNTVNRESIKLLKNSMDAQVRDVYSDTSYLLIDGATTRLRGKQRFTTEDMDDLQHLQDQLQQDMLQSQIIQDLFVCFPTADAVLSNVGILYGDHVTTQLQSLLGMTYEEWQSSLRFLGRRSQRIVGTQKRLLLYHQYNVTSRSDAASVVIVAGVNMDMLRQRLESYNTAAARFSIRMEDGTVIASASEEQPAANSLFYRDIESVALQSDVAGWIYVLTPTLGAVPHLSGMLRYIALYYLLCLCIGSALILLFSKHHYTPLQNFINTMLHDMKQKPVVHDEYSFIENGLTHMLEEMRGTDRIATEARDIRRQKLLHDLARGRQVKSEEVLTELGLSSGIGQMAMVLYSINRINIDVSDQTSPDDALQLIDRVISCVAQEFRLDGCHNRTFTIDDNVACMITTPSGAAALDGDTVMQAAGKVVEYLHTRMGISVNAGISACHDSLPALPEAYREAHEALGYMAVLGLETQAMRFSELCTAETCQFTLSVRVQYEQRLLAQLKGRQFHAARETAASILAQSAQHTSRREMELYIAETVSLFVAALNELNENLPQFAATCRPLTDALMKCTDVVSLNACIAAVFDELERCELEGTHAEGIGERDQSILDYIRQNYANCDLNINALSEHFGLTPSYLSRIVRRCTGTTALDYIQSLRIEQAKKLMSTTGLSLQEIAEQVGYGNKLNIIRAFKRYEGITPGVYRESAAQGR